MAVQGPGAGRQSGAGCCGEQASRDCGLGELERDIATVASNLGANLDQLLSTVRDRPRGKGLCRLRVRLGLYRQPRHRSALLREADENDAKADVPFEMSAVGGAVVPATWSQLPLIAEAVELVRTINICATNVPVSRAWCNSNSMKYGFLNHCFKDFALRDFFNSLSYKQTIRPCPRCAPSAPMRQIAGIE